MSTAPPWRFGPGTVGEHLPDGGVRCPHCGQIWSAEARRRLPVAALYLDHACRPHEALRCEARQQRTGCHRCFWVRAEGRSPASGGGAGG